MTVEITDARTFVKVGRGIEVTVERLVELLREAYPDAKVWEAAEGVAPQIEYVPALGVLGIYFVRFVEEPDPRMLKIARGGPVPTERPEFDQ